MALAPHLAESLDSAEAFASRVNAIDIAIRGRNARTMIRDARSNVQETPALTELFDEAEAACSRLSSTDGWNKEAVEEAQGTVAIAVQTLRYALDGAQASERARSLGLAW